VAHIKSQCFDKDPKLIEGTFDGQYVHGVPRCSEDVIYVESIKKL